MEDPKVSRYGKGFLLNIERLFRVKLMDYWFQIHEEKINEVSEFYNFDFRDLGTLQANTGWEMSLFHKWLIRNATCLKYTWKTGKGMRLTRCTTISISQAKNSITGKEIICHWRKLKDLLGDDSRKSEPHCTNQNLNYS